MAGVQDDFKDGRENPRVSQKIPPLGNGSLLAMQPVTALIAAPRRAVQLQCRRRWWLVVHNTQAPTAAIPPVPAKARPRRRREPAARKGDDAVLVTESKGRALKSAARLQPPGLGPARSADPAQLAETGPYCSGAYVEPQRPGMYDDTPTSKAPTYVSAKASRYEQEQRSPPWPATWYCGRAACRWNPRKPPAPAGESRRAQGQRQIPRQWPDDGRRHMADLQLDNGQVQVDNADSSCTRASARGSALYAKRGDDAIIRPQGWHLHHCEPGGRNAWQVKGNTVTLNPATAWVMRPTRRYGSRTFRSLYAFIYFPIDDRRQSGSWRPRSAPPATPASRSHRPTTSTWRPL